MEGNKQINQSKHTHNKSETKEQQQQASENEIQRRERWGARLCPTAGAREQQPPATPRPRWGHDPPVHGGGFASTRREANIRAQAANEPQHTGGLAEGTLPSSAPSPSVGRSLGRGAKDMEEQRRPSIGGLSLGFFWQILRLDFPLQAKPHNLVVPCCVQQHSLPWGPASPQPGQHPPRSPSTKKHPPGPGSAGLKPAHGSRSASRRRAPQK